MSRLRATVRNPRWWMALPVLLVAAPVCLIPLACYMLRDAFEVIAEKADDWIDRPASRLLRPMFKWVRDGIQPEPPR